MTKGSEYGIREKDDAYPDCVSPGEEPNFLLEQQIQLNSVLGSSGAWRKELRISHF